MPDPTPTRSARTVRRVPLRDIRPDPAQPRRLFPREGIEALADSIRLHGQLSPLLLRVSPDGQGYRLIAGARRLMALKRLGRTWAEAQVLPADDLESGLIALLENLQREDLHYLDVAAACRRLLDTQPISQAGLAAGLSISPSTLANRLRLLKLPASVRDLLRRSDLSERHARALLGLPDEAAQLFLARQAAEQGLSVAQLEARVAHAPQRERRSPPLGRLLRDSRMVVNALMHTVKELVRIGVPVRSRVEEGPDRIDVIVTIPVSAQKTEAGGS